MSNAIHYPAKGRSRVRSGFSLIELVIVVVIIGIIAAIAIPRMSRGSAAAADSAVSQNLQILRSAIDLYQTEHNGVYPDTAIVNQLTMFSSLDGQTTAAAKNTGTGVIYGPYLRTIPQMTVGAQKGSNGIGTTAAAGIAWVYDSTAGTVTANATGSDSAGKAYSSY